MQVLVTVIINWIVTPEPLSSKAGLYIIRGLAHPGGAHLIEQPRIRRGLLRWGWGWGQGQAERLDRGIPTLETSHWSDLSLGNWAPSPRRDGHKYNRYCTSANPALVLLIAYVSSHLFLRRRRRRRIHANTLQNIKHYSHFKSVGARLPIGHVDTSLEVGPKIPRVYFMIEHETNSLSNEMKRRLVVEDRD